VGEKGLGKVEKKYFQWGRKNGKAIGGAVSRRGLLKKAGGGLVRNREVR